LKKWKIVIIGLCLVILSGCGKRSASQTVSDFLGQYQNLSASVLTDLETVISKENFTNDQKNKYRDVLKKQYQDLRYEIVSENYNGDQAIVEAKIIVYDFYKTQSDASIYLTTHINEFENEEGSYDNSKCLDYKLEQLKNNNVTVEYTIEFNLEKNDNDEWEVQEMSNEDLEKIHGIYNYDLE